MRHILFLFVALAFILPQTIFGAESFNATADQVVYDLPTGVETKNYLREGQLFRQWGSDAIQTTPISASVSPIAEGSDGKIYIANPISGGTKGYLVGTRIDDTVVFSFPQVLQQGDSYQVIMRLEEYTEEYESAWNPGTIMERPSYRPTESQEIVFTIEGETLIQVSDTYFGFVDTDGKWAGYGEYALQFSPFNDQLVTVPEEAEEFDVALTHDPLKYDSDYGKIYKLLAGRKKGNEVYIQGMSRQYPESWIKGTVDGDRITFEGGQLLGTGGTTIEYFCTGIDTPEYIPGYDSWNDVLTLTPSIKMAYDSTTGIITALDIYDCFFINSSRLEYTDGAAYLNPALTPQPKDIDQTPMMPEFKIGVNTWENGKEPLLTFTLRPINIYGQLLDVNNLGFFIEVEGEPYVFTAYDYWLPEDMTIIPWGFYGTCIWMENSGLTVITFENEEYMKDVKIYAVNKVGDNLIYSAPQSPDDPTNQEPCVGIKTVTVIDSPIVSTVYFDMKGCPVTNPTSGFYMRKTVHENGQVTYSKVAL